jgi:hypothetical protein
MTQHEEKRQYDRVAVSLPARFSVLIPEHTFRPVDYECEVLDLSIRGAMVNVRLSPENYSLMLQKTRYCRLEFNGVDLLPDRVTGRAVWLQPQGNDDNRSHRIGLFFEDCPDEIVSALKTFVDSLKT